MVSTFLLLSFFIQSSVRCLRFVRNYLRDHSRIQGKCGVDIIIRGVISLDPYRKNSNLGSLAFSPLPTKKTPSLQLYYVKYKWEI